MSVAVKSSLQRSKWTGTPPETVPNQVFILQDLLLSHLDGQSHPFITPGRIQLSVSDQEPNHLDWDHLKNGPDTLRIRISNRIT